MKTNKIDIMRENAALGDAIFAEVVKELKKGSFKTEIDLANFIKLEIESTGGKEAFPVIVTSGKRAGNDIHPLPTKSKLEGFVIIDFGIKMNGYCSDMTRTVYLVDPDKGGVGRPTEAEIQLYNSVLRAQNGSLRYIKAGFPVSASDAYVRGFLSQHFYNLKTRTYNLAQYFIHTLGHGISKNVHESPKIYYKSKEVFKSGQVVTSEPGIYIPKTLGIRIEDMCLIDGDNLEILTKSSKKLLIINK